MSRGKIGATILRMTAPDGDYEYQAEFALPDDRAAFTRRVSVKNRSDDEQLFQTMFYVTPPLAVGADTAVIFPGSLPVGDTALLSLADGTSVSPRSSEPLALLWSEPTARVAPGFSAKKNTLRSRCAAQELARPCATGRM